MSREDDPLKQTPAAELDRDNRVTKAVTREPDPWATDMDDRLNDAQAEIERLQGHMRALAVTSVARDTAGIFKGLWQGSERECEELRAEVERLLGVCKDKTVLLKDAYAEIERLTNAIRRIDGINDNPANYNPAIDDVCAAILRPHLDPKP